MSTTRIRKRENYTTGEAAAVLGVSQQTVIRCFDAGELKGYRVPGSRFRRVPHHALLSFAEAHGIEAAVETLRDAEELHAAEALDASWLPGPGEGEPLTTGDIADLLQVAPRTVAKWVDSREIRGYRVPGSADRRVSAGSFEAFLADHPGFREQVERRRAGAEVDAEVESPASP